jgi:hypothetical protein
MHKRIQKEHLERTNRRTRQPNLTTHPDLFLSLSPSCTLETCRYPSPAPQPLTRTIPLHPSTTEVLPNHTISSSRNNNNTWTAPNLLRWFPKQDPHNSMFERRASLFLPTPSFNRRPAARQTWRWQPRVAHPC